MPKPCDIRATAVRLSLSGRTHVMGILNVTPDSFSEKGKFFDRAKAITHALEMERDGADIIDVGGESTRPGALEVSADEEIDRVIPVIEALSKKVKIPLSVDTRKSSVAEEALKAGASIVNDISALTYDPLMGEVAAQYGAMLILMHMKGTPRDMQVSPAYSDVVGEIRSSLKDALGRAKESGVKEDLLIIDPGIGFGKTVEHNLEILRRLDELKVLRCPICIGTSRKSFIGKILDRGNPDDRLCGTLATCVIAIMNGARIIRVHDVKEALQAAQMTDSVISGNRM